VRGQLQGADEDPPVAAVGHLVAVFPAAELGSEGLQVGQGFLGHEAHLMDESWLGPSVLLSCTTDRAPTHVPRTPHKDQNRIASQLYSQVNTGAP